MFGVIDNVSTFEHAMPHGVLVMIVGYGQYKVPASVTLMFVANPPASSDPYR